jgi:MFS family permease
MIIRGSARTDLVRDRFKEPSPTNAPTQPHIFPVESTRPAPDQPTRVRFAVLAVLAIAAVLSYLLRVSLSTAGSTVQVDLRLSDPAMGHVFSAFFLGYFWTQLPAGWLGQRFGARRSLTAMGFCWAAAMCATAWSHSFGTLYASRVAQGIAQGGLFAVTIVVLRDWFPPTRRGIASSVITGCMGLGAILANGLTGQLLGPFGWRAIFLAYALAAIVWSVGFYLFFRDTPDAHPLVNPAERALIRAEQAPRPDVPSHPPEDNASGTEPDASTAAALGAMARSFSMWLLLTQSFFQAFGFAFFITWFPTFLEKTLGVDVKTTGTLAMWPLLGGVIGGFLGGALLDAILFRTGRKWPSRCGLSAAGLLACAGLMAAATLTRSPPPVVALATLAMFFAGFAKPAQWAAAIDLTGSHSAVGFAIMNMGGNLGAYLCPIVVGEMLGGMGGSPGGQLVLLLIAGIHLAAAITWLSLDPDRPVVGGGV